MVLSTELRGEISQSKKCSMVIHSIMLFLRFTRGVRKMIYYDKEKKTYYVKFRYTDWAGKSKSTTKRGFATKKEAKNYEINFKRQAKGLPTMTVKQMSDELMESLKKRLKPASIRQKEMLYRLYVNKYLGDMQICDVTPNVVRSWQDNLPSDKSKETIAAANTVFCSLMNYAVKYHGLPSNPFTVTGKTGGHNKRTAFWEKAQFDEFIKVVNNKMYHAIFNLFFYSGLRRGELLALTADDVDLESNTISVNKSKDDYGRILPPKTKSSTRVITMPSFIMQELKEYRESLYEPPQEFFLTTYALLKWHFNKYKAMCNLPNISIHGLRHSHASYLIQKGLPITSISARLGHANSHTSLAIYSHMYADGDKTIANTLENEENSQM